MASRTAGTPETALTLESTSAVRMAEVTSRPSRSTVGAPPGSAAGPKAMVTERARAPRAQASEGSTPRSRAARVTQRYMAPVSR